LQEIDVWQHRRQQEMARVTFDPSQREMLNVDLPESTDPGIALRKMLSYLEVVREEVKQRTFRPRQYAILESLYRGIKGWRTGLIFGLLHRFGDPRFIRDQQEDEEWKQFLRSQGDDCEAPGEPEREELLRLLEEEIANVREEFAYAEKANEESAAIERDACLAPEGEAWSMMLRQEAALDHSIDRKVRILLRLRKESADFRTAPPDLDDGPMVGNIEEIVDSDILTGNSQTVGAVENSKLNEQHGNIIENKGSCLDDREAGANVKENTYSYGQSADMLLKRKGVIGNAEFTRGEQVADF
jgi:hypothetical protein